MCSTRFIRRRLTTTEPRTRGDEPPYPLFLPTPETHSGTRCSLAILTIAWISSTESGLDDGRGLVVVPARSTRRGRGTRPCPPAT